MDFQEWTQSVITLMLYWYICKYSLEVTTNQVDRLSHPMNVSHHIFTATAQIW